MTVEEFRTSFGTQEFCMCLGNAIAINVFPTHLTFDPKTRRGVPNPFSVVSLIFNIQRNAFTNVRATHSVSAPLQIKRGGSIGSGGLSSSYSGMTIQPGQMQDFLWIDSTTQFSGYTVGMNFDMIASGYSGSWDCGQPGNHNGSCDIQIDPVSTVSALPTAHILSRTGSYDGSTCNTRVTQLRAYDTGTGHSTIFVRADSTQNMTVSIPKLIADTITYTVSVVDSMYDGFAYMSIRDTFGNVMYDTVRYCTIADTHPPQILFFLSDTIHIQILENRPWDRKLDSVLVDAITFTVDTSLGVQAVRGKSSVQFTALPPQQDTIDGYLHIHAVDLANNSTDTTLRFAKWSGITPKSLTLFRIYPNPSFGVIAIKIADEAARLATLQNLLGRVVAQSTIRGTGELDISTLAPGTYILRVAGVTRKIVKN